MPILRIICLPVLLGLAGCTYLKGKTANWLLSSKKLSTNNRTGEAKVVGVIELVNPEQNYVLINCEQRLNIPAGTEIVAQGIDGSKTKLKVTPERKGNYITADILEGTPQMRDLVLYRITAADLPTPPPMTATLGGALVPMKPVMQADVIPPLDAPFQPLNQTPPPAVIATPVQPRPQPPPPAPVPVPTDEPAADPSKLLPVIR